MRKEYFSFGLLVLSMLSISIRTYSQISIPDEHTVMIDFTGFKGRGFSPDPDTGQLDSDTWSIKGLSEGDLDFGSTLTTGDFARGISRGGVSTGGIYAFEVDSGNMAIGAQPTSSDWSSGSFILKIRNNSGKEIIQIDMAYSIQVYNDQGRANGFNFSHSSDNITYKVEDSLDYISPEAADLTPLWMEVTRSISLRPLGIDTSEYYYLKWEGDDVSGIGSRDEFGLDNIRITATLLEGSPSHQTLKLIYPVGGETLYVGDSLEIIWTYQDIDSIYIKNYLLLQDKYEYFARSYQVSASPGKFKFLIPPEFNGDSVRFVLTDFPNQELSDTSGWVYLIDTIPPRIIALNPSNHITSVSPVDSLVVTFNELVEIKKGAIKIFNKNGNLFDSIIVASGQVSGYTYLNYVIKSTKKFKYDSTYYVLITPGTFTDIHGNPFQDIFNDTTWTFTIISPDLFFSEYIEGSGFNKALEIANLTGSDVDLCSYQIWMASSGTSWSKASTYDLAGMIEDHSVLVICNARASDDIKIRSDSADGILDGLTNFNGDDAVGLAKSVNGRWILLDVIGEGGKDPGIAWNVAGVNEATAGHSLLRKSYISFGNMDWEEAAGTNPFDSEWKVYAADYFENLGMLSQPEDSVAEIISFYLAEQTGPAVVDSAGATVDIEVIFGTRIDSLFPVVIASAGTIVEPASGDSVDFSGGSVFYTVIAENHRQIKVWTVNVSTQPVLCSQNDILTFVLPEQTGSARIDTINHTVSVEVANGTNPSCLAPAITVSEMAAINPVSGVLQDFSSPFIYTVIAEDGTSQDWTVTITIESTSSNDPSYDNGVRIYPNPNNGKFNVIVSSRQVRNFDLQILDIHGKLVYTLKCQPLTGLNEHINLEGYAPGIYVIRIMYGSLIRMDKLIIQ